MKSFAVPVLTLCAVPVAFFAARHYRELSGRSAAVVRILAVLPLFASGTLHLVRPHVFLAVIPPPFPPEPWFAVLTGVPELLGGCGLFSARTRRAAAVCLAVYLIAIFPANVYIAGRTVGGISMPRVPARTLMQAGYMLLILVAGWGVPAPVARLLSRGQRPTASLTPLRHP